MGGGDAYFGAVESRAVEEVNGPGHCLATLCILGLREAVRHLWGRPGMGGQHWGYPGIPASSEGERCEGRQGRLQERSGNGESQ